MHRKAFPADLSGLLHPSRAGAETRPRLSRRHRRGAHRHVVVTVRRMSGAQSRATNARTSMLIHAMMADVEEVEVVVAHNERATLRVGDVFLKVDADQTRTEVEVAAMAIAPVPTPEILWRKPPVLALAALPGAALGHLGEPSTASSAAWTAAGTAVRSEAS